MLYAADHSTARRTNVWRRWPGGPAGRCRSYAPCSKSATSRFCVTVGLAQADDPQVLAIADPNDVPTGQLAKLTAPCVVFSADKHLRRPGLARPASR